MAANDVWLRLTDTTGVITALAIAAEALLSLLGYLPDIGHAAELTVLIGTAGAAACYGMHLLAAIRSR